MNQPLFLQCLNGPRGVGSYSDPPASFKELLSAGKIEQIELVQDFNIRSSYVRCFYKVDGIFYQRTPCDDILKPKFEDEKSTSSGSFVKMNGDPQVISILDKMYELVHTQSFILIYRLKQIPSVNTA